MDSEKRTIDIFVRDRVGDPIRQASIKFLSDGHPLGMVSNAEGRGRVELPNRESAVEVVADVGHMTQSVKLSKTQDSYTFYFDIVVAPRWRDFMEKHLPLIVGLFLFLIAMVLAFAFNTPNPLQSRIIVGAFSLGGGAIATEISGMIRVDLNLGTKLVIGATGALAIFVILYRVLPA